MAVVNNFTNAVTVLRAVGDNAVIFDAIPFLGAVEPSYPTSSRGA